MVYIFPAQGQDFGPKLKIQNSVPNIYIPSPQVSKKVCHIPVGQKLIEDINFLETGCFQPRAILWRPTDPPKNYLYETWNGSENFIRTLSLDPNLFNFFSMDDRLTHKQIDRQTHTHAHTLPSIYRQANF